MRLRVIDKDSFVIGYVMARIGLKTYCGAITRFTDKTVWCKSRGGSEQRYSRNNNVPSVVRSALTGRDTFIPLGGSQ